MVGQREEVIRQEEAGTLFSAGKLRGKVAVVWLLCFSDLSAFSPISDSGLLFLRPIRTYTIAVYLINAQNMLLSTSTLYSVI